MSTKLFINKKAQQRVMALQHCSQGSNISQLPQVHSFTGMGQITRKDYRNGLLYAALCILYSQNRYSSECENMQFMYQKTGFPTLEFGDEGVCVGGIVTGSEVSWIKDR